MKIKFNYRHIVIVVLCIVLVTIPLMITSGYILRVLILSLLYTILATSLNLISGIAGQVSMGHSAFYAVGAYTSALLVLRQGWPTIAGLVAAAIISAILGFLIGYPSLKLTGGYLAVITLGFAEVVRLLLINLVDLTNGNIGLSGIPNPRIFGVTLDTDRKYYPYALAVTFLVIVVLKNIEDSRFGRNLKAIKNDEIAAEVSGIKVHRSKVFAFSIAGAMAGIAGALYAHLMMYIDPNVFTTDLSTTVLAMVVLGGMGNLYGTILVAFLLTILPEALRGFQNYRMLVYGVVLVSSMLLRTVNLNGGRMRSILTSRKG